MIHFNCGASKKALLFSLISLVMLPMNPAFAALDVGAPAPDFKLLSAQAGQVIEFSLSEVVKQGPVVVYFFPAAFTAGCNREAHAFAERINEFTALGATVIGISNDNLETIKMFSVQECAGKFKVAADPDSTVIRAYDAKFPLVGKAQRVSYLIGKNNRIHFSYSSLFDPDSHIDQLLRALKADK